MATQRPSPEIVIQNLPTKSDKIRALANAGYSRTEISNIVGVRYQHVRKVLLDAGITGGLRHAIAVPQPAIPVAAAPSMTIPLSVLVEAGFSPIGKWVLSSEGGVTFEGKAPDVPGTYAFALDDVIVYVGVTLRSLKGRMGQYRRGYPRQRTSFRINGLIRATLQAGKPLKVLIAMPKNSEWNGLPVNTAAGLEVALIQAIRPEWNKQIGKQVK